MSKTKPKASNPEWLQRYQGALEEGQSESAATAFANDGAHPHRALYTVAAEIRKAWPKPYFGAVPYIQAMASLDKITDLYGADDATDIVLRFLSNATTWRGDVARRIKAELKALAAPRG